MTRIKNAAMKGLTAIELLIITSIIALIAVFATPMMSSVFFETELEKAARITEKSIEKARVAARFYDTNVQMRIEADGNLARHSIIVSIPRSNQEKMLAEIQEVFPLPDTVRVVSGDTLIQFNSEGEVDSPAMLTMASTEGDFDRDQIMIE